MDNSGFFDRAYNLIEGYLSRHRAIRTAAFILLCLAASIPGVLLGRSGIMRPVDLLVEDSMYQNADLQSSAVAVVAISTDDIEKYYTGGWNLGAMAELIEALNSAPDGAPAVIGIDAQLYYDVESEDYRAFLDAVSAGNVVLGYKTTSNVLTTVGDGDRLKGSLNLQTPESIPEELLSYCASGYINTVADIDGAVRHYLWEYGDGENVRPSFAVECYREYCLKKGINEHNYPRMSSDGLSMLYLSSNAEYENTISPDDICSPDFTGSGTAGKIVIIGAYSSYIDELCIVNMSDHSMLGNAGVQANAVINLIEGESITEMDMELQLAVLEFITAAIIFIILRTSYGAALVIGLTTAVLNIAVNEGLRKFSGIAAHPLYLCVSIGVCLIVGLILYIKQLSESKATAASVLESYVDTNIRNTILLRHRGEKKDLGEKRQLAILYADIMNFTAVTEERTAEETLDILNSYITVAEKCIHANGGVLDSFTGDSVTAFWDDEECGGRACEHACRAALEITAGIRSVDEEIYDTYGHEISYGIGVHFGSTVLGDIGSDRHRAFTIVGETLDTVYQLEGLCTKGNVFISESVRRRLPAGTEASLLPDRLRFKHKLDKERVYLLHNLVGELQDAVPAGPEEQEDSSGYTFHVLGTRGSYHVSGKRFMEFGGATTCFIIKTGTHAVVLDAGTGLYEARELLSDCTVIDVILTHMHYDHCIGLLDWSLFPKDAALRFYGNFRGWLGKRTINQIFAPPFWPVDPVSGTMIQIPEWGERLTLKDDINIVFYPAPHPNAAVVMSITAGDKKIGYMVDCEKPDGLPFNLVAGSDLLVYDGMYDDAEYKSHEGWGHSTWQEGAKLAARADAGRLIITHHSPKNNDSVLLEHERLAQTIFPDTVFARSGMVIKL